MLMSAFLFFELLYNALQRFKNERYTKATIAY